MQKNISAHKPPQLGLSEKEIRGFSLVRTIAALANPGDRTLQAAAARDLDICNAAAAMLDREARGTVIPLEVLRDNFPFPNVRGLSVGTAGAGGNLVETDVVGASFIDLLTNHLVVKQLGAQVLTDLHGNVAIPRQTGGATAYWVAEAGAPTESDQAFDQVLLTPHTCGAYTDYTRRLLLQSSIDIEAFVRLDLAKRITTAVDLAAINGSGSSNQPRGILNTSGIGSVAGGTDGAVPSLQNIVALETATAIANADIGSLGYLTNAKVRGKLKATDKTTGGYGQFIWGDAPSTPGFGEVNGYRAAVSNQVPSNLTKGASSGICSAILFGNWADLVVGMWGGLDILVDPYTNSTTGTIRVVAFQDVDIGLRHPESFSAMLDALTT
jgi:HK97 family phage major capsid protein